jgi:hypothetical protein
MDHTVQAIKTSNPHTHPNTKEGTLFFSGISARLRPWQPHLCYTIDFYLAFCLPALNPQYLYILFRVIYPSQ